MKATEAKTAATSHSLQAKGGEQQPFFQQQEERQGAFFGNEPPAAKPFFTPFIQTKLTIGQPGDKYEQEADAMAEQVVQRMADGDQLAGGRSAVGSGAQVQRKCAECTAEKQEEKIAPKLQLKSIFESNAETHESQVQRKCEACAAEQIQPMRIQRMGEEEESELQAKGTVPGLQASPDLESRLNATKGSGNPLPDETRSSMESAFGTDFSGVRVHTNSGAVQMNQELGAQAFTHGSDVYFGAGKYDPGSREGNRLLGHELTHVVQQKGLNTSLQSKSNFPNLQKSNDTIDRSEAAKTLLQWVNANNKFLEYYRTQLEFNFVRFLKYTSSRPGLSWSQSFAKEVLGGAFENASSELLLGKGLQKFASLPIVKKQYTNIIAKALAAGVGWAVVFSETGPGAIIAFVIGVFLELIVGSIFDPSGEYFTKGSLAAGNLIEDKIVDLSVQHEISLNSIAIISLWFNEWIQNSENQEEVNLIVNLLDVEKNKIYDNLPHKSDDRIFELMLHDWILEHAGDEEDPDNETLKEQWVEATNEAKKRGLLPNDPDLDNHPEIFAYQFRAELGRLGLNVHEAQKVIDKVTQILIDNPAKPSETVKAYFDDDEKRVNGYTFNFKDIVSYDNFIKRINETYDGSDLTEKSAQQIKEGNFIFKIYLDLESADNSIYVDEFLYYMNIIGDTEWYALNKFTWAESPD